MGVSVYRLVDNSWVRMGGRITAEPTVDTSHGWSLSLSSDGLVLAIGAPTNGENWQEYLRQLATAEGIDDPSEEDLRRLDRRRKGKKTSNKDWLRWQLFHWKHKWPRPKLVGRRRRGI